MNALLYLDFCNAKNTVVSIVRSPARLLLWIAYMGFFAFFITLRTMRHRSYASETPSLPLPLEVAIGGACLLFAGTLIALFASIPFAAFRSRAEARMLCGSCLSSSVVVTWLQVRRLTSPRSLRALPGLFMSAFIATSSRLGIAPLIVWTIAALLFFALLETLQLLVFIGRNRAGGWPFYATGALVTVVGGAYAGLGILSVTGSSDAGALLAGLPWTPASAVHGFIQGSGVALAVLAVAPLTLIAVTPWIGRDVLPELYESTMRATESRELRGAGRSSSDVVATLRRSAQPAGTAPGGAATILWKDWLVFRRSRGAFTGWLALCVVAAAAGLAAHVVTGDEQDVYATVLVNLAIGVAFIVTTLSTTSLAGDVAKPLWWMSAASVRERLWMWTLSRSWRIALPLALVPLFAAAGRGSLLSAIVAAPAALIAVWSFTAIGVALYPAFPGRVERGPLMFVRMFITIALFVPSTLALFAALDLTSSLMLASLAGVVVLALEGVLLIELAATQLGRNSAATLATSEAA